MKGSIRLAGTDRRLSAYEPYNLQQSRRVATARVATTEMGSHRLGVTILIALLTLAVIMGATSVAEAQVVKIHSDYPRLVFRPTSTGGAKTYQSVRDMYNANGGNNAFQNEMKYWVTGTQGSQPVSHAARYVITGNLSHAQAALDHMASSNLYYTSTVEYVMHWALAYDWIRNAWGSSLSSTNASKLASAEQKIANWVSSALNDVEPSGHSLWHRRGALGAGALVGSLALPAGNATYDKYRERAFAQWQKTLKMLEHTGAWPEGPTYWGTSRGLLFPIAWMCYESAVTSAPSLGVSDPVEDMRMLGLWQAYGERGDGSMNRYGDIGSQVQYSNGTLGRTVDLYAAVTRDPALTAFSRYARKYRYPFYHSEYAWICAISYDTTLPVPAGYDASNPGASLTNSLPQMMVFGATSIGKAIIRSGWNAGDTQISFKAGDYMVHHGHADQGTFTIFKHDKLVTNSGGYGTYEGQHRLNYYVRSVGTNTLLIQRPDEVWRPSGGTPSGGYVNDGGQRLINSTGSTIYSVDQWLSYKTSGLNYETGDLTAVDNVDGSYSYVASDITRAYNSTLFDANGQDGKVSKVQRNLMYLTESDVLLVFDRVKSTNANYKKKWLLHTPNKFVGGSESVVRGSASDGITVVNGSSIPGNIMTMTNGGGRLFLQTLLPQSYTVNKVGGTNHRFYVETDGSDANGYNGSNISADYSPVAWHDVGDWRIEISPASAQLFDNFLVALAPRSSSTSTAPTVQLLVNDDLAKVVRVQNQYVMFGTQGPISEPMGYDVASGGNHLHVLSDLVPGRTYALQVGASAENVEANEAGVISFNSNESSAYRVSLDEEAVEPPPAVSAIEFTVTLEPDFTYQNVQATGNRHNTTCTVAITKDSNGNLPEDYTVAITKTGGTGEVTVVDTDNLLVKQLRGSSRTDGTTGTGTYNFSVKVTGAKGGSGTVASTVTVRPLGDVNNDGSVTPTDKGKLNAALNNISKADPFQAFDLNCDGYITPTDKGLLNAILNGVALP